jgi:hypothetical protein
MSHVRSIAALGWRPRSPGARGYLVKDVLANELVGAIREVYLGSKRVSPLCGPQKLHTALFGSM